MPMLLRYAVFARLLFGYLQFNLRNLLQCTIYYSSLLFRGLFTYTSSSISIPCYMSFYYHHYYSSAFPDVVCVFCAIGSIIVSQYFRQVSTPIHCKGSITSAINSQQNKRPSCTVLRKPTLCTYSL